MRCAQCSEFIKYSAGMQCEDCKYTCHKKCYPKVVTKCISKSNAETDPNEEKLNHRIPHRFENFSNMGANWCCHCGYMLPLGRKNKKCTGSFAQSLVLYSTDAHTRMRSCLSCQLHSSSTGFLWNVDGACQYYYASSEGRKSKSKPKTKRQTYEFGRQNSTNRFFSTTCVYYAVISTRNAGRASVYRETR